MTTRKLLRPPTVTARRSSSPAASSSSPKKASPASRKRPRDQSNDSIIDMTDPQDIAVVGLIPDSLPKSLWNTQLITRNSNDPGSTITITIVKGTLWPDVCGKFDVRKNNLELTVNDDTNCNVKADPNIIVSIRGGANDEHEPIREQPSMVVQTLKRKLEMQERSAKKWKTQCEGWSVRMAAEKESHQKAVRELAAELDDEKKDHRKDVQELTTQLDDVKEDHENDIRFFDGHSAFAENKYEELKQTHETTKSELLQKSQKLQQVVDGVLQIMRCNVCLDNRYLLTLPECNHTVCTECYPRFCEGPNAGFCPKCREPLNGGAPLRAFLPNEIMDYFVQNELLPRTCTDSAIGARHGQNIVVTSSGRIVRPVELGEGVVPFDGVVISDSEGE